MSAPTIIMLPVQLWVMWTFSRVSSGTAGWIIFAFLIKYLSLNVARKYKNLERKLGKEL